MPRSFSMVLSAALLGLFIPSRAPAQTRYLDPSFNGTGVRTMAFADLSFATALRLDAHAHIVVAGNAYLGKWSFALARLRPDGTLDSTFGNSGMVTRAAHHEYEMAQAMATGADATITLAGFYGNVSSGDRNDHFATLRFLPDGRPDSSFGAHGAVYDTILNGRASAVLVQKNGRTVVIGTGAYPGSTGYSFALHRLNPDGGLDSSFGTAGIVLTPFGQSAFPNTALLLPDERILVGGHAWTGSGQSFLLARYRNDGSLDSSFGTNGISEIPVSYATVGLTTLLLRPDGSYLAVGQAGTDDRQAPAMLAVNTDGTPDMKFGQNGQYFEFPSGRAFFTGGAVLLRDGEIVIGGTSVGAAQEDFALLRYAATGTPDSTLAGSGVVTTRIGSSYSYISGLAIQGDDRILAAGFSWGYAVTNEFAVARYHIPERLGLVAAGGASRGFRLSPNPASGVLFVTHDCRNGLSSYRISGVDGREIQTGSISGSPAKLDIGTLHPGTYIFELQSGTASERQLFIRQ